MSGESESTWVRRASYGPTSGIGEPKYAVSTRWLCRSTTSAEYGHGPGIGSTGSRPIPIMRSAACRRGISAFTPVKNPAYWVDDSGMIPFASYVTMIGTPVSSSAARIVFAAGIASRPMMMTGWRAAEMSARTRCSSLSWLLSTRGGAGGTSPGWVGSKARCTAPCGAAVASAIAAATTPAGSWCPRTPLHLVTGAAVAT